MPLPGGKKKNGVNYREGMQLLDMDSDSGDQVEHFSLSGMNTGVSTNRRKSRCCCSKEMLCMTFVSCFLFAMLLVLGMLHMQLQDQVTRLQASLNKTTVESGNQGNPEEFQKLHSSVKELETRLSDVESGDEGLESLRTQIQAADTQISDVNKKIVELQKKVDDAAQKSLPNQLKKINTDIARAGSEMNSVKDDVSRLKTFRSDVNATLAEIQQHVQQLMNDNADSRHDVTTDNPQLKQKVDSLTALLDQVNASLSVRVVSLKQKVQQNQLKIQELSTNVSATWSDLQLLKLSTARPDVPTTPTQAPIPGTQPPAPGVDAAVVHAIIREALHNYSLGHSTDMTALNDSIQNEINQLNSSIVSMEMTQGGTVSARAFLTFKDTSQSQYESIRDMVGVMGERANAMETRLGDQSERIARLEQAGASPIDGGASEGHESDTGRQSEGHESDTGRQNVEATTTKKPETDGGEQPVRQPGPGGDKEGEPLIGADDGHLPDWLHLETTERGVDAVEQSTIKPVEEEEATSQGVFHSQTISTSQDVEFEFSKWDGDGDGYVTYYDVSPFFGPSMPSQLELQRYDLDLDGRYSLNEMQAAFGVRAQAEESFPEAPEGDFEPSTTKTSTAPKRVTKKPVVKPPVHRRPSHPIYHPPAHKKRPHGRK